MRLPGCHRAVGFLISNVGWTLIRFAMDELDIVFIQFDIELNELEPSIENFRAS